MRIDRAVPHLARLRLVVGALGEGCAPPWWPTRFFSDAGQSFLLRLFPRTALSAAVRSVTAAAAPGHDAAVGRADTFHLFRLPSVAEIAIDQEIGEARFRQEAAAVLRGGPEALRAELVRLAGESVPTWSPGPVLLGHSRRLALPESMAHAAGLYLASLADEATPPRRCFPYWEGSVG